MKAIPLTVFVEYQDTALVAEVQYLPPRPAPRVSNPDAPGFADPGQDSECEMGPVGLAGVMLNGKYAPYQGDKADMRAIEELAHQAADNQWKEHQRP